MCCTLKSTEYTCFSMYNTYTNQSHKGCLDPFQKLMCKIPSLTLMLQNYKISFKNALIKQKIRAKEHENKRKKGEENMKQFHMTSLKE